jgi:epoxyqueuosine reductase
VTKDEIIQFIHDSGTEAVGFASVDRFKEADEAHHPSAVCKNAKTVIVFGKSVPRGMLRSPRYSLYAMHRSYHTVYPFLDELALKLSTLIEDDGHLAVPVPTYAPLVYKGAEPWGILSLKHAAVCAGLGSFGRSGLVYNPRYGSLLRFGAVVTDGDYEPDPVAAADPCPAECRACSSACPSKALQGDSFDKMKCMLHTIRHGIYPLALKDESGIKNIELIINTAGHNYWLKCNECLKVCPLNR